MVSSGLLLLADNNWGNYVAEMILSENMGICPKCCCVMPLGFRGMLSAIGCVMKVLKDTKVTVTYEPDSKAEHVVNFFLAVQNSSIGDLVTN